MMAKYRIRYSRWQGSLKGGSKQSFSIDFEASSDADAAGRAHQIWDEDIIHRRYSALAFIEVVKVLEWKPERQ